MLCIISYIVKLKKNWDKRFNEFTELENVQAPLRRSLTQLPWEICDLCTKYYKQPLSLSYIDLEINVIQSMLPTAFVNCHRTSYKQHCHCSNSLWDGRDAIYTTIGDACVCVCVCKI